MEELAMAEGVELGVATGWAPASRCSLVPLEVLVSERGRWVGPKEVTLSPQLHML